MAIIQISKIQQRSGNLVDLPQLDEGEFGWASDTKRLFIGKTVPTENIEVLTSYTNINFNQLDGSSDTQLNITNPTDGEILAIEPIGSTFYVVNKGGQNSVGGNINLGDALNVKLLGGATGYVLETDGLGNLSWINKSTIVGTSGVAGGSNTTIQFNNAGSLDGNPNLKWNYLTNEMTVTGNITATQITASSNGLGTNYKVGDDAYIGDINVVNTMVVKGQQDSSQGYIIFGNGDTTSTLGRSGTGPLTYNGALSVVGNVATGGVKTDNYYYANGSPISFSGTYSDSNVAAYLPTYTGTMRATTITSGSSATAGFITGDWTLTSGSKLQSTYADLAEYYEADQPYEPGTVVEFGGEKEVTIAEDGTTRVAGVVTTNPAYVMNTTCQGIVVAIALQGRVPVKVRGKVRKGDMMVSAGNGYARPWNMAQPGMIIGKSIENFEGLEGTIEVAVGRL